MLYSGFLEYRALRFSIVRQPVYLLPVSTPFFIFKYYLCPGLVSVAACRLTISPKSFRIKINGGIIMWVSRRGDNSIKHSLIR
jgi:hypothetical protein